MSIPLRGPTGRTANSARRAPVPESPSPEGTARAPRPGGARRAGPPRRPRRNPTAEILTISVLVSVLVLAGVGLMLWGLESRILQGPTPTPTATPRAAPTATPDIRATLVAEDMATQIARLAALQARMPVPEATPLLGAGQPPGILVPGAGREDGPPAPPLVLGLPGVTAGQPAAPQPPDAGRMNGHEDGDALDDNGAANGEATPTPIVVVLPQVGGEPVAPEAAPTPEPVDEPELPTETPTPTATPTEVPTETPTPTPLPPPPDAPTPTPSPTPQFFSVGSLSAAVRGVDTTARVGPSNTYDAAGTFGAGAGVNLLGRTANGEWVYACCTTAGQPAWIRQAYVTVAGNNLGPGAPQDANPNDVRWLNIQPLPGNLAPLPAPTPIAVNDYPFYRYNTANQARLGSVPRPPVRSIWPPNAAQAGGALVSPAIVAGGAVKVASLDNHLYSFDRLNGNQRWRYSINRPMRVAASAVDNMIYIALEDGSAFALTDQGIQAVEMWRATLPGAPVTPFAVYQNALYIGAGQAGAYQLVTVDRGNGAIPRTIGVGGAVLPPPTVGGQLVFVGGTALTAFDATLATPNVYETVWTREDIAGITTPALYTANGVRTLAELYVVDSGFRVHNLDANTGREQWVVSNGEPATGIAYNQRLLFVSGPGYVKALERQTGAQVWRTGIPGEILGGPIADDQFLVITTQVGIVQIHDANGGNPLGGSSTLASAGGAPAVSYPYVFVPGLDGRLHALQGGP